MHQRHIPNPPNHQLFCPSAASTRPCSRGSAHLAADQTR
jgi:hypothetical protein